MQNRWITILATQLFDVVTMIFIGEDLHTTGPTHFEVGLEK